MIIFDAKTCKTEGTEDGIVIFNIRNDVYIALPNFQPSLFLLQTSCDFSFTDPVSIRRDSYYVRLCF